MATLTTRLKLRQPERGALGAPNDPVNVLTDYNASLDSIDSKVNCFVCTSANRPVTPFQGQFIFETDTGDVRNWSGTSWDWVSNESSPKGIRQIGVSSVDSANVTGVAEGAKRCEAVFTAESTRRYWVEGYFYLIEDAASASPCSCSIRLRWAAGGAVTTAGAQIGSDKFAHLIKANNTGHDFYKIWEIAPGILPDGQVAIAMFLVVSTATKLARFAGAAARVNRLIVRDVGI